MDSETLSYLNELMQIAVQSDNSRRSVEKFILALRKEFVFDNVAVYLQDRVTQNLEIAFARAIGRSKSAEADAAWGEDFAGQVVKKGRLLLKDPDPGVLSRDRLHQAYLLGLPIRDGRMVRGAIVFVRFGGPVYEEQHIQIASLASGMLSMLVERGSWAALREELEELKRHMQ